MQKFSHQTQTFAGFTLDLTRGCLLRGTQEIKLRPKPFDALRYLVENPGRLISKSELIHALWPDTAVTDDSLVQCLMEVRRALGDETQQIIKTVPRRGYILDTEVKDSGFQRTTYTEETAGVQIIIEEEETNGHPSLETLQSPVPQDVSLILPHTATRIERLTNAVTQHKWRAALGLLTLGVLAAGIVYFTRPTEAIDSVAVMPFVNVSGDPNTEYLSDGLSDSIINNLSHLPSLKKVISFNSVLRYKGKQTDPQAVGRELGVRAVLMGRLIQQGDQLSISTELINVRDNRRLWGEQYERKMSDLPLVPRELARQISDQLQLRLTREDEKQLNKRYTENAEAYQLYLKGLYFRNKVTRPGSKKAIEYFEQAIAKDPNYALAYTGLADVYITTADFNVISPADGYSKARSAVTKALELDPLLAEAHSALAKIKFSFDWDWSGAEKEYQRAIELHPNGGWNSDYLSALGKHQEALVEVRKARERNPLSLFANTSVGRTLYFARQYDQAIEEFQKVVELDPNFTHSHRGLGLSYEQKGMYPQAIAEFQKVRDISRGDAGAMALGHAYAVAGKREEALKIIDELKEKAQREFIAAYWFAMIHMGLGEKDQAFTWLDKAFTEHDPNLIYIKVDPRFDSIRSDPRFTDLLRRMKLAT